jgi:hypothetical protein
MRSRNEAAACSSTSKRFARINRHIENTVNFRGWGTTAFARNKFRHASKSINSGAGKDPFGGRVA